MHLGQPEKHEARKLSMGAGSFFSFLGKPGLPWVASGLQFSLYLNIHCTWLSQCSKVWRSEASWILNSVSLQHLLHYLWSINVHWREGREVTQSCPTLWYPTDGSLPGSSVHGIFQARILEWVAISFSRRYSRPRDWTRISRIVGRRFTLWATREVQELVG